MDAEKFSSTVDSSSKIPTNFHNEENTHVSSETISTCSSSSVKNNFSQIQESDYIPAATESSSISESPTEVFSLQDLQDSESAANVFQKEEIYDKIFQECDTLKNITENDTNVPTSSPIENHEWVPMNRKFVQKEGYRLGINPGIFYKSNKGYFVAMPNGSNYEIILTNENPVPCNVEVFVDNRPTPAICFRLRPEKPKKFDGPTFCKNKFEFLRSKDAPERSGISSANRCNGIIEAVFTPQKVESVRSRTVSEPIPFSRNVNNALQILGIKSNTQKPRSYTTNSANAERGIDITNFCQGATALRGEQTPKAFKRAETMETDDTRRVIIRLRLIARSDEPSIPSEEDICSMCPPSVEELLDS